jgi:hypothetical protein
MDIINKVISTFYKIVQAAQGKKQRHPLIKKAVNMNSPQTCSFVSDDFAYKGTDFFSRTVFWVLST